MSGGVVVLTGGVGGAKLVLGLIHLLAPDKVTAIVNTGDDFHHLGLHVSPDIDTLLYTLSGRDDRERGWGRAGESWAFMAALRALGGEDWFALGDGDLALHVLRTQRLARGESLTRVIAGFAAAWAIGARVLPMSDDAVRTIVDTEVGALEFQRYFVERRCQPRAIGIRFAGAGDAAAAPGVLDAIAGARAILIAPSNPYLSIDPILAVPDIRLALEAARAPVVAVSPIIGGNAVKGPTAKLMAEFGVRADNAAIAAHYGRLLSGLVIDPSDDAPPEIAVEREPTLMIDLQDRVRVAGAALRLAARLA